MTLEERAEQIAKDLEQESPQAITFDPVTIMIILSILVNVVKLFMKCDSASRAVAQLADPGWFHKLLMRRVIKKHTKETKLRNHRDKVEAAIIANGKSVSTEEMEGHYSELGPQ